MANIGRNQEIKIGDQTYNWQNSKVLIDSQALQTIFGGVQTKGAEKLLKDIDGEGSLFGRDNSLDADEAAKILKLGKNATAEDKQDALTKLTNLVQLQTKGFYDDNEGLRRYADGSAATPTTLEDGRVKYEHRSANGTLLKTRFVNDLGSGRFNIEETDAEGKVTVESNGVQIGDADPREFDIKTAAKRAEIQEQGVANQNRDIGETVTDVTIKDGVTTTIVAKQGPNGTTGEFIEKKVEDGDKTTVEKPVTERFNEKVTTVGTGEYADVTTEILDKADQDNEFVTYKKDPDGEIKAEITNETKQFFVDNLPGNDRLKTLLTVDSFDATPQQRYAKDFIDRNENSTLEIKPTGNVERQDATDEIGRVVKSQMYGYEGDRLKTVDSSTGIDEKLNDQVTVTFNAVGNEESRRVIHFNKETNTLNDTIGHAVTSNGGNRIQTFGPGTVAADEIGKPITDVEDAKPVRDTNIKNRDADRNPTEARVTEYDEAGNRTVTAYSTAADAVTVGEIKYDGKTPTEAVFNKYAPDTKLTLNTSTDPIAGTGKIILPEDAEPVDTILVKADGTDAVVTREINGYTITDTREGFDFNDLNSGNSKTKIYAKDSADPITMTFKDGEVSSVKVGETTYTFADGIKEAELGNTTDGFNPSSWKFTTKTEDGVTTTRQYLRNENYKEQVGNNDPVWYTPAGEEINLPGE